MRYQVKALRRDAGIVSLMLEAASDTEARRVAEAQGLQVLSLRGERGVAGFAARRRERFPLLLFSQELATLLGAGLALIDALESLADKERDAGTQRLLRDLVRLLYEGRSLSQAMAAHPQAFPDLFVALLRSSERTGGLADALTRYIGYRARLDQLRQRVVSASIYPLLLLVVGGAVLLFLVSYVVPRFSLVFDGMGGELPWLSQLLLEAGRFVERHRGAVLGGGVGALLSGGLVLRLPAVRRRLAGAVASLPLLHSRIVLYRLAGFYRALGILLQGGIPLLTATGMVRGLLGTEMGGRLDRACARVREGQRLSAAMESAGLAPPVALRMLRAGEQSGNLGEMMERAAEFYEQELARWIEWFVRLFEPLLMAGIGILIGTIVILMYLPIFELAGSIR